MLLLTRALFLLVAFVQVPTKQLAGTRAAMQHSQMLGAYEAQGGMFMQAGSAQRRWRQQQHSSHGRLLQSAW